MPNFITQSKAQDVISLDNLKNIWIKRNVSNSECGVVCALYFSSSENIYLYYNDQATMEKDFAEIKRLLKINNPDGGFKMVDSIKNYLKKNEEALITLALIILIDQ